jgi:hypothetical protein
MFYLHTPLALIVVEISKAGVFNPWPVEWFSATRRDD